MRRLVLVPAGLLAGFAAAVLVVGAGLLAEAMAAPAGVSSSLMRVAAILVEVAGRGLDPVSFLAGAVWRALLWVCLAPLCLVAMVAEAAGLRSRRWLAGGTGLLMASIPTVLRALDSEPPSASRAFDMRLTALLLLSGAAAGGVFWLVAGRRDTAER